MSIIAISGKIGSGKDTVGRIIQWLLTKEHHEFTYEQFMRPDFDPELVRGPKWEIKKFAGKLKQIVSLLTGISVEDLERQEVKDRVLGREWEWNLESKQYAYRLTVRGLLQRLGTDAMRDVVHPNIHVNALFVDYKPTPVAGIYPGIAFPSLLDEMQDFAGITREKALPNWLITDLRFPNELEAVNQRGGLTIRVERYKRVGGTDVEPSIIARIPHPSETALDNAQFAYTIHNNGSIEDLVASVKEVLRKAQLI